jgi:hypothetical protein
LREIDDLAVGRIDDNDVDDLLKKMLALLGMFSG